MWSIHYLSMNILLLKNPEEGGAGGIVISQLY